MPSLREEQGPAPPSESEPDLGQFHGFCRGTTEGAGNINMPHRPAVRWTTWGRQRQLVGETILPTRGWGKQSVWLAASGSRTPFPGRSPHPLCGQGPKVERRKAPLPVVNIAMLLARRSCPRPSGERTNTTITPVWPCEPLCAPIAGGAESLPLSAGSGRIWGAVRTFVEDDSEALGPFPRDERKSRRKNRRFCGAGSLTTARSAGSCGILKRRSSVHEIVAMALFSVEFSCLLSATRGQ